MKYFSIKNFDRYQHYKDRRPPWIKLHVSLLDDYGFISLSDASKSHLMLLWLLASQTDNKIPHDVPWIKQRIGARGRVNLAELFDAGFLEPWNEETAKGKREEWSSRYVSAAVKASVLALANHKCCECGATEPLEIDHIVPISRGGTSDPENLQVLCRPCNRRKRTRLVEGESATQKHSPALRTQKDSALLETETEGEAERETEKDSSARERVEGFWLPEYRPDLDQLLDLALPTATRREGWLRSLLAMYEGMHPPARTPEQMGRGLRAMLANSEKPNWNYYAGCVRSEAEGRTLSLAAPRQVATEDADFVEASELLQSLVAKRDPLHSHTLTLEGWALVDEKQRQALKAIGGIDRVLTAKPSEWTWVVKDFLKAQRGAAA